METDTRRLSEYFIQFFELKILKKVIDDKELFDLWMSFKEILKDENFSLNKVRKFVISLYGITEFHKDDDSPHNNTIKFQAETRQEGRARVKAEKAEEEKNRILEETKREEESAGDVRSRIGSFKGTLKRRPTIFKDFGEIIPPQRPDLNKIQNHFDNLFQSKLIHAHPVQSPTHSDNEGSHRLIM